MNPPDGKNGLRDHMMRISDIFKDNTQIDDLAAIKAEGVKSWSRLHTKSFKVKSMLMSFIRNVTKHSCAPVCVPNKRVQSLALHLG